MKQAPLVPIVVALLVLASTAVAQEAGDQASRYNITPSDGGFVRLDTQTGTVSHCLMRDGTWICEPAEEVGRTADAVAELIALVDSLTGRLDRLSDQIERLQAQIDRLAALDAAADAAVPAGPEAVGMPMPADEGAEPVLAADEALDSDAGDSPSLASRLIAPLQQMVGDIKRGIADPGN